MSKFTFEQRVQKNLAELDDEIFKLLKRSKLLEHGMARVSEWEMLFQIAERDRATRELFEELNLDPKNPVHWRALIDAFAKAYRPVRRRTTEWTPEAQIDLGLHALEASRLLAKTKTKPSRSAVARHLVGTPPFKEQYGALGVERMRELLRDVFGSRAPLDDTSLPKLRDMNPEYFFERYMPAIRDEAHLKTKHKRKARE